MKIHIAFKKMDSSESLKNSVNEKCERLSKFVTDATELHWVFYLEGDIHVADLRVKGPHVDFFAQAKTPDMYRSVDDVVDKIEKQLKKNKEIVKDHLHRNRA